MFFYQIWIAIKSLRRNPILSILMVGAIALGIAISTAFVTMYNLYSGNPIPDKSDRLFYVEIDNWDPNDPFDDDHPERAPNQITYRDMVGIMASDIPTHQSGMFKSAVTVHPEREGLRPYREKVRLCFGDFFPMFDVPFLYGGGWQDSDDAGPEPVVVIDAATNHRLFGGADSVGRSLKIEDRYFTVVGVMAPWRPTPKYYDPHSGAFDIPEAIYLPFEFARVFELPTEGNSWAWGFVGADTYEETLSSELIWIQMWVELDGEEQRQAYASFLDAYGTEQKALGRHPRQLNNRLLDVMQWLREEEVVPDSARTMLLISVLFLFVCSVNLIGLLLGKFIARAPEVGVRRALGASRGAIFAQHLVECEVVGVLGGVIGLALSVGVLELVNRMLENSDHLQLNLAMALAGLGLSLIAGLVAGLYPAWRICRVAPAGQLKLQ